MNLSGLFIKKYLEFCIKQVYYFIVPFPLFKRKLTMNTKILENIKTTDKKSILMLTGSVLICLSAGLISKLAITPESLIWYEYLFKPALNPPNWLFQAVWTILYLLMGVSLYFVVKAESPANKKLALIVFGSQLFLNIIWAPVFFGLKSIGGGLTVTILLLISIYLTFYKFYKISVRASVLLVPHVLWVSYAIGLNFTYWILNA